MADFNQPRKKIALDNAKLGLVTKCPTAEGKISKLSWGINKNNPFIRVYTGDPADESERTKNGRIQAELDLPHLYAIIQLMRQAVVAENGWKNCLECFNYIFPGGQRSEKPVNTANVWIGKDKDGCVFISLVDALAKDRPVIKFDVAIGGIWMRLVHGDGRQYTKAESSSIFALGYATLLENLYSTLAVDEFVPYVAPERKGGGGGGFNKGGGGGYQKSGGGYNKGGGYNNAPAADSGGDEDNLPF